MKSTTVLSAKWSKNANKPFISLSWGNRAFSARFRHAACPFGGAGDAREHAARRNHRAGGARRLKGNFRKAGGHQLTACRTKGRAAENPARNAARAVRGSARNFRAPQCRAQKPLLELGLQQPGDRRHRRDAPRVRVDFCPGGSGSPPRGRYRRFPDAEEGLTLAWTVCPRRRAPRKKPAQRCAGFFVLRLILLRAAEFDGLAVEAEHIGLAGRDALLKRLVERFLGAEADLLEELADEDDVREALEAVFLGELRGRYVVGCHVVPLHLYVDEAAVEQNHAAGLDVVHKLIERGAVHRDEHVRVRHERRADRLVRKADAAVRGAAAHFRAVGGEPRKLSALDETGIGDDLAGKQNALTAEAGENHVQILHFSLSPFVPSLNTPSG